MKFRAMAATAPKSTLSVAEFEAGPLGPEHVDIAVEYCGICHSDLSMLNNEWGMSAYPFVPGHEVVGTITAAGPAVKGVKVGERVGLGWFAGSCMACNQCMSGHHNLCPTAEQTIVGRHGGFATSVRAHWSWAIPFPKTLDPAKVGPLFCGGITVFNPMLLAGVKPTDRVGVIGIGGLGHLALQFLNKWGCEVVAFTSSDSKRDEAIRLGAHSAINSRNDVQLAAVKGTFNFILVTANVTLNWQAYLDALAPGGKLHFVGAVLEPLPIPAFALISGQKSVAGSPLGSPAATRTMLDFVARHKINVVTEEFPMSKVNDALAHLESGKARYRVVLKNDLK